MGTRGDTSISAEGRAGRRRRLIKTVGAIGSVALALTVTVAPAWASLSATGTQAPIGHGSHLLTVTNTGTEVITSFAVEVGEDFSGVATNVVPHPACEFGTPASSAIQCTITIAPGAMTRMCYTGQALGELTLTPGESGGSGTWGLLRGAGGGSGFGLTISPSPAVTACPLPGFNAVGAPTLAVTGDLTLVSGSVLVKVPGASRFVALTTVHQIPFGTIINATHGRVSVTTARPHGGTQTSEFFEGEFILTQGRSGRVVATLTGGNFSVCATARQRSHATRANARHASGRRVVRKLWANAHGSFSTKGNYAAAAVEGTEWLTEDLCEGTLIRVTRDRVLVTNLVSHRRVTVRANHQYLAAAP